ncbi:MAG: hypothetical protein ACR2P1_02635 [Pseudomonadales bacterium]
MKTIAGALVVLLLALLHVYFPAFDRGASRYRHIWIPLSGGVALGYVFFYMLPKLSDYTAGFIAANPDGWEFLHYHFFVIALLGLLTYLWLDRLSHREDLDAHKWRPPLGLGFGAYSLLIGYLIADVPRAGLTPYILILIAFGPHFLSIDHQLRLRNEVHFDRFLRWIFAVMLLTGWTLGVVTELPKSVVGATTAFLSGAILVNVMTEELPNRRTDRMWPFLVGVAIFLLIALIIRSLPRLA